MSLRLFAIILGLCLLFGNSSDDRNSEVSIKSRLLVPIYFKYGVSFGYDDNVFRFSDTEKNNENSYNYMGQSETFDSSIIKPELKVLYSPYILGNRLTNFIFYFNWSNYNEIKDKSNQHYSFRFDYKVGPYNWFKIGYKTTKNNFLRYYSDKDMPGYDYAKCSYDSERIYISYSFNLRQYGWSRIKISKSNQFFNPDFTEFDLGILSASINHNYNYKSYGLSLTIFKDIANNTSFQNGLNSTSFDRSYGTSGLRLSIKRKMSNFLNHIKLGFSISKRLYLSQDSSLDVLHSGRSHVENSFFIQLSKEVNQSTSVDFKYIFTNRKTNSDLDWSDTIIAQDFDVAGLKSFIENQFLIKFTYDLDLDLFY
ncbi:MAG: hypothetical protein CMG13_04015 [Candidatus Marinimicrobia bacterium]|nr:hypothetical protein [Candidatus Neomarinimicrobiota bacterium]